MRVQADDTSSQDNWRTPDTDSETTVVDQNERIRVPEEVIRVATQPVEHPPREYVERIAADIQCCVELPRGGHFIALEELEGECCSAAHSGTSQ